MFENNANHSVTNQACVGAAQIRMMHVRGACVYCLDEIGPWFAATAANGQAYNYFQPLHLDSHSTLPCCFKKHQNACLLPLCPGKPSFYRLILIWAWHVTTRVWEHQSSETWWLCSWSTHAGCHAKDYRALWRVNTVSQSDDESLDVHFHITEILHGIAEMKSAIHQCSLPWCADQKAQWYLNLQIHWKKMPFEEIWSGWGKVPDSSVLWRLLSQIRHFFCKSFPDPQSRIDPFLLVPLLVLRYASIIAQTYVPLLY